MVYIMLSFEGDKIHAVCVELPYDKAGEVLTVEDMRLEFERVTHIPTWNQRIIHKGRP